jgi:cytochrome bd ubiquinol oxidase subunit II
MESVWYFLLAGMFVVYVVLDGFDFGAGILHLFVARTDEERRTVLGAIGPVWDGNEVWLLAGGGTLVYAFPRAYAVAFSGFYLALMIVLWLLVLRGISIEFRSKVESPLWRSFWDAVLAIASIVMTVVLGVALGNLVRGLPIGESGWFEVDLFQSSPKHPGTIDAYTALVGVFALVAIAGHGAVYLNWKTAGAVQARARRAAPVLWVVALAVFAGVTVATYFVRPEYFLRVGARPLSIACAALSIASVVAVLVLLRRGRDLPAFLASSAFFALALLAIAGALHPTILASSIDPSFTLTAHNAAASPRALTLGLLWWIPALVLAIGYFTYLFWSFRGKAGNDENYAR